MELIEVSSYTENEKEHIAKEHLIQKQMKKNGLKDGELTISSSALRRMISGYTREAGVRNLERKIGEICRKAAREIYQGDKTKIKITESNLEKYLGKEKYSFDKANEQDEIGIVRGLAWTSVGGDTLQIEVNVMPGKGDIKSVSYTHLEQVAQDTERDYYMSAEEAKEYGIIDSIITNR